MRPDRFSSGSSENVYSTRCWENVNEYYKAIQMTCEILTRTAWLCCRGWFCANPWLKYLCFVLKAHKSYLLLIIKESSSPALRRKCFLVVLILRYCMASTQNSAFSIKTGFLSLLKTASLLSQLMKHTNVVFSGLNPCALLSLSMSGKKSISILLWLKAVSKCKIFKQLGRFSKTERPYMWG